MNLITGSSIDLYTFHDAELCLVEMDRENSQLRLSFKKLGGDVQSIRFMGIVTYRIDNILYQNVASRLLCSKFMDISDEELERMMRWTCSGSSDQLLISEQQLLDHTENVRKYGLDLFYADPSWGAEIGVVAENIEICA